MKTTIRFEQDAIVVTVGAMGTGKSTFLRSRLAPHYIISTDDIRQQLCGDFKDQTVSAAAFEILDATFEARAKAGFFTVVDSTGTARVLNKAVELSKKYRRPLYALKFPALAAAELTPSRMQHRMNVLEIYYKQVRRVEATVFHKAFTVFEILADNRDDIDIVIGAASHQTGGNELSDEYQYMVVPDLHGEYWVFGRIEEKLEANPNLRVIQLGDIGDRGESSYKTFRRLFALWERGLVFAVPGNHDNKLYRWMKKYLAADDRNMGFVAGGFPAFGMTASNGLDKTLSEIGTLSVTDRLRYAVDWCRFYESLPLYLKLKRDHTMNFFVHAGITTQLMAGLEPSPRDLSQVLYAGLLEPQTVRAIAEGVFGNDIRNGDITRVAVHVGHTYGHPRKYETATAEDDGAYRLWSHDIGLGKRKVLEDPEFVVI